MNEEFKKAGRGDDLGKGNLCSRSSRSVDLRKYMGLLDGADMTDTQKMAYLKRIWSVVDDIVLERLGIHPVQKVCGKLPANSPEPPTTVFNRVSLEDHKTTRGLKSHKPEA